MQSDLKSAMDEIQILINELQKKTDLPSPIVHCDSDVKYVEVTETPKLVNVKKKKGPKPYSEMSPEELAIAKAKKGTTLLSIPMVSTVTPEPTSDMPTVVSTKKVIKVKKTAVPDKKQNRAILAWNAYKAYIKDSMESDTSDKVSHMDVMNKAVETKKTDPQAYKDFTDTWLSANP